jgi:acetylglutamate kinase
MAWLKSYHGKIVVVKFGGNAMVDEELKQAFAQDMAYLRWVGIKPIVVHGGGPQISAKLAELGIDSEFKGGFRVTDDATIGVVRDVLRNDISQELATLIQAAGAETVIMSGEDSHLIKGAKTSLQGENGESIDIRLGWRGHHGKPADCSRRSRSLAHPGDFDRRT